MKKGKVLLVDAKFKIRSLLKSSAFEKEYEVILADGGKAALQAIEHYAPDIVVADLELPDMSRIEFCRNIRRYDGLPIIYLSCLEDWKSIAANLVNFGNDYLAEAFEARVLMDRIHILLKKSSNKKQKVHQDANGFNEVLTPQEERIIQWIGKGYTNKEIALQLKLAEGTVRTYNYTIFQKLQVKNRTQAIVRAQEASII